MHGRLIRLGSDVDSNCRRYPKKIEIIKTDDRGYTVIVDDLFASWLTIDEVMGCVASALFSNHLRRPMFCQNYEEWDKWHRKYSSDKPTEPVALLTLKSCLLQR